MSAPRTSACQPWVNGDDLSKQVWIRQAVDNALRVSTDYENAIQLTQDDVDSILAHAATAATEILYQLSARQFTGVCGPVTIRPISRPVDGDNLGALTRQWSYGGYGSASTMTMSMPPIVPHYGPEFPPIIELLDFPIREIIQVKIDGVVIPEDEYELRDFKQLVRIRPTAESTPTERWGWPTSQIQDLPDTEDGTFSITYTYGQDPGVMGRLAALELAQVIALPMLGDVTRFPERTTSISRQGVSAQVASFTDALNNGGTGLYNVDLWLMTVNPGKQRTQSLVWSPDRGKNRRQANPTIPS